MVQCVPIASNSISPFSTSAFYSITIYFLGSFSGGFSPKESIYNEVSTTRATIGGELPLDSNEQKPYNGKDDR